MILAGLCMLGPRHHQASFHPLQQDEDWQVEAEQLILVQEVGTTHSTGSSSHSEGGLCRDIVEELLVLMSPRIFIARTRLLLEVPMV